MKIKPSPVRHATPLITCLKVVCVITCPVSSDVILLLLILRYNSSLRHSLIYALVYPFNQPRV